jgi:exodeoxyribonuclease VII large subunit
LSPKEPISSEVPPSQFEQTSLFLGLPDPTLPVNAVSPQITPAKKKSKQSALAKKLAKLEGFSSAPGDLETPASGLPEFYTVEEITRYLDHLITSDSLLGKAVRIRGELSNVKFSSRGHVYFTLKDKQASISGIIWASLVKSLPFKLKDGMAVDVVGKLEIYAPSGTYSIVCQKLEPVGIGSIQLAFEQLKEKLSAEGLFSPAYKKPLPEFPQRIGIVTSRTGAVIHDMLRVLQRKNPLVSLLIHPVKVQGEGAAMDIAKAIQELNHPHHQLDLIIVARGGGSLEDLFCFSEEVVVRSIFASALPVLTGIGHEPDFSLADAVADVSASTPTAAAERAVPDLESLREDLEEIQETLQLELMRSLYFFEQKFDQRATEFLSALQQIVSVAEQKQRHTTEKFINEMDHVLLRFENQIGQAAHALDTLNPLKTMARGFCVVTLLGSEKEGRGESSNQVLQSIQQVSPKDSINIRLIDGLIQCEVKETHVRQL